MSDSGTAIFKPEVRSVLGSSPYSHPLLTARNADSTNKLSLACGRMHLVYEHEISGRNTNLALCDLEHRTLPRIWSKHACSTFFNYKKSLLPLLILILCSISDSLSNIWDSIYARYWVLPQNPYLVPKPLMLPCSLHCHFTLDSWTPCWLALCFLHSR